MDLLLRPIFKGSSSFLVDCGGAALALFRAVSVDAKAQRDAGSLQSGDALDNEGVAVSSQKI
jgi:hypothetical protein